MLLESAILGNADLLLYIISQPVSHLDLLFIQAIKYTVYFTPRYNFAIVIICITCH